ncbi:MAG: electron transfer flavoprotein subunit alpha [Lentisphaeria bacterium]|nr:electron transfer flavoprotein subunit alpha [Lentisphaeria bacterium]
MSADQNTIAILSERCAGCARCVSACPFGAIHMDGRLAVIDDAACALCGACVSACSEFNAIVMLQDSVAGAPKTHGGEVWVFGEITSDRQISPPTAELLGKAGELACVLKTRVGLLLIGDQLDMAAKQGETFGARTLYLAEHAQLREFKDEPQALILMRAARAFKPVIVLGAATAIGRAVLPRAAVLLRTGLTADCTHLAIDPASGSLMQTRPAFGGNIMATIQCPDRTPQMATVRPGVFPLPARLSNRKKSKRVTLPVSDDTLHSAISWLKAVRMDAGAGELRDAAVIVTAGAGTGGPAGVALVNRLAHALGGVLGSTRSVVDAGWADYACQVGQTGVTVQPKTYIACGVSGAIQHIVGMRSSDRIIAINKDPDAPIFTYADIGVVGDLRDIIPALLKELTDIP